MRIKANMEDEGRTGGWRQAENMRQGGSIEGQTWRMKAGREDGGRMLNEV